MLITRLGAGVRTSDDLPIFEEKVWTYWEANGTIAVGSPVIHDHSTDNNLYNLNGTLVVEGSSASQVGAAHRILGSYQGHISAKLGAGGYSVENVTGLSTAGATTTTGPGTVLSGFAAFDGDVIRVLSYGQGYVLADGDSTDINSGDILTIATIGGRYEAGTNQTTGTGAQVWSLGIHSGAFEAGLSAFHRCL